MYRNIYYVDIQLLVIDYVGNWGTEIAEAVFLSWDNEFSCTMTKTIIIPKWWFVITVFFVKLQIPLRKKSNLILMKYRKAYEQQINNMRSTQNNFLSSKSDIFKFYLHLSFTFLANLQKTTSVYNDVILSKAELCPNPLLLIIWRKSLILYISSFNHTLKLWSRIYG